MTNDQIKQIQKRMNLIYDIAVITGKNFRDISRIANKFSQTSLWSFDETLEFMRKNPRLCETFEEEHDKQT